MSLEVSLKVTMSANFILDVSDIEEALDENPSAYKTLCEHIVDSDYFWEHFAVPTFHRFLDEEKYESEYIGDGCGYETVHVDALWDDYVEDSFIAEMKHDQLVEQLHAAVNEEDFAEIARLAALLSNQRIAEPWEG